MNWNNLTMEQRSNLMKLYLKHGITSLDTMKEHYNQYAKGGHLYSGVDTETEWDPETFGLTNYRAISKPNKKQDLTINQEQRDRAMQVLQEERAKAEAGGYKANIVRAAEEAAAKGWAEDEIDFQNYMYHTLSQWGGNEEAPSSADPLDNLSPKEREYLAHIQAGLKMIADYTLSHNGVDNRPDNPRYTVGNLPSRYEEKQWIEWCNKKGINPYGPITEYVEAANKAREIQSIQKQIDETQKNSFKSWWNPGLTDLAIDVTGLGGGAAQFYSKTANAGKIISAGTDVIDYGVSGYNAATGQLSEGDIGNAVQLTGYGGAVASGIKSIKPWIYDAAKAAKVVKYVGPLGNAISIPFDIVETIRLQEEHTQERERELKELERLKEKKQELLNDSYNN